MALSRDPLRGYPAPRRRGWMLFWIVVTLVAIVAVWYFFLGPGTANSFAPRSGGQ